MRNIVLSMMVSLDGCIEGPSEDLNWHVWDGEMDRYMIGFFDRVDTILFGRKTYQLMESFWPTPASAAEDHTIADRMNNLPKIVYSRTLGNADWNNSTLVNEVDAGDVSKLKQQPGKDMVIFGGAGLAASFMQLGLIDEFQLIVNPVILGDGNPLFKGSAEQLRLKLVDSTPFDCGNVVLRYKPEQT